jgi:hypothetical protein
MADRGLPRWQESTSHPLGRTGPLDPLWGPADPFIVYPERRDPDRGGVSERTVTIKATELFSFYIAVEWFRTPPPEVFYGAPDKRDE